MKLIRPVATVDAVVISSNVIETAPAAYAGGTTYALGAVVGVATGTAIAVYTSLQNANTGHAPAGSPTWWKHSGDTFEAYVGGTTYAAGDRVILVGADSHHTYESLQAANTGHAPASSPTWWLDLGATNQRLMFDGALQSQTTNPDSIVVQLQLPAEEIADSLYVGNINASSLRIQVDDPLDGGVYDETFDLVSPSGISDLYAYFFELPARLRDKFVTGLGNYAGALLTITLSAPGETVACGALIVGFSRTLGGTQWGAELGIRDYSVKDEDDFGNLVVVERGYRKTGGFSIVVETVFLDELITVLADYRATAVLFVGDDDFGAMAVFGYLQDWKVVVSGPRISFLNLNLASLT